MTCSASGPYGLAGTIEAFMADSAGKSLKEFLDFLLKFAQVCARQQLKPLVPAACIPSALQSVQLARLCPLLPDRPVVW